MLIITGIGRSGTSAVAEYAKQAGLDIGFTKWNVTADAGNEDHHTLIVNKSIIRGGKPNVLDIQADAVKDPFFTADVAVIQYWWGMRKDLFILYCRRDPDQIVASQHRQPDMTTPAFRCFPDLIRIKEIKFIDELKRLGVPHKILDYPFGDRERDLCIKHIGGNKGLWERVIR